MKNIVILADGSVLDLTGIPTDQLKLRVTL